MSEEATFKTCDAEYQVLEAEFRRCEIKCQASLDQLRAAARELNAAQPDNDRLHSKQTCANIERAMRDIADRNRPETVAAVMSLSHRERNVFELIGQGLSTQEVAECLHIAPSTVETYRERLKDKLNIETGLELSRFAVLWFSRG